MKCSICKQEKDNLLFRKDKRYKKGHVSRCLQCETKYKKDWYSKNREHIKKRTKITNLNSRERIREYIVNHLKANPCVVCGEKDIVVLEFDHLRDKKCNITQIIRNCSFSKLQEEIDKCQILCANCHRRKTAKDQNWYKNGN